MAILRLQNLSSAPFFGWKRLTVDEPIPDAMSLGSIVKGRQVGLNTHVVDVKLHLERGERVEIDTDTRVAEDFQRLPLPPNPIGYFGGPLSIGGSPMEWVSLDADGAGYSAHLRLRTGAFVYDVWMTWYPDQPSWWVGELMVTFSDPSITLLQATHSFDMPIEFGDAIIMPIGGQPNRMPWGGRQFADGQSMVAPLVFMRFGMAQPSDFGSMGAVLAMAIGGVGISKLYPDGNPRVPSSFDARSWTRSAWSPSLMRMYTWDVGVVGPNRTAGDTGAQTGDQIFVRDEPMIAGDEGAETVAYLGALKMANRPCHHRELDGAPLDPARHTTKPLIFWQGRPHSGLWSIVDRLGKIATITPMDANGWFGPDPEHWLINTLVAGCRLTGSPACQYLLMTQATIYMLQWTTVHGWSTSDSYASRAVGYELMNAVYLWRNLEDRVLAQQVRNNSIARWQSVILPTVDGVQFWADGFKPQNKVSLWQMAVEAYGMWLWGREFGIAQAQSIALQGARTVLQFGTHRAPDGTVLTYSTNLLPGGEPDPIATNIYHTFGFPLAAWLLRTAEGADYWQQLLAGEHTTIDGLWMPPGD